MALHGVPDLVPGSTKLNADVEGNLRSTRSYWCYFDPADSEFYVARNLPPGLARWTSDPGYVGFVSREIDAADDDTLSTFPDDGVTLVRRWTVTVQYGPWTALFNSSDGNPINQPPIASIEATEATIPAVFDTEDTPQPIVNTVGDPYDPPLEKQQTICTLVVRQNLRNPAIVTMLTSWVDHVNKTAWNGFPARTLLMAPISLPSPEYYQDGGYAFYPMEFRMLFNPDTHDKKVLNQGFRQYDTSQASTAADPAGNPTYPLKNVVIEGQFAQEPVLLDASGAYLPPPVDKDDVVINTHKVYPEVEFSTFPFSGVVIPGG